MTMPRIEATENGEVWSRHPACDRQLAVCRGYTTGEIVDSRDKKNAVLFAASRKMLAACEGIVAAWDRGLDALTEAVEISACREAVAEVKGRPA